MENHSRSSDLESKPSVTLNDFALLQDSSAIHQFQSPALHVEAPPRRNARLVRPSTASAVDNRTAMLPSAPNRTSHEATTPGTSAGTDYSNKKGVNLGAQHEEQEIPFELVQPEMILGA